MIDTAIYGDSNKLEKVIENWAWAAKRYRGWVGWGNATPPSGTPVLLLKEESDGKAAILSYAFLTDKNEWYFVEDNDNPLNEWHYWCIPPLPPQWQDEASSFKFDNFII